MAISYKSCPTTKWPGMWVHAKYTKIGNYFVNHVAAPNYCLIGIEMCHPDSSGKPTDETRASAIALCRDLCGQYGLNPMVDVYLHNDITGKWCHKYYCEKYHGMAEVPRGNLITTTIFLCVKKNIKYLVFEMGGAFCPALFFLKLH